MCLSGADILIARPFINNRHIGENRMIHALRITKALYNRTEGGTSKNCPVATAGRLGIVWARDVHPRTVTASAFTITATNPKTRKRYTWPMPIQGIKIAMAKDNKAEFPYLQTATIILDDAQAIVTPMRAFATRQAATKIDRKAKGHAQAKGDGSRRTNGFTATELKHYNNVLRAAATS
jgi:hypothetical protein